MIVSRWILTAKDPDALLAHQKFIRKRFWAPDVVRVYAPIRGADSNVIVWEEQHESMAAYRKRSEERHSDPEFDTIVEQRLRELVTDGHHEVWEAVDLE